MKKYYKYLLILLIIFSFDAINSKVNAHAVQLGYCTNCNGDLRIWIEHWHGASFGASSLTVTITVNGVPTTITGATTLASPLNTPAANLPGCFTPLVPFAACTQANTYGEWVAYDFPGVSCGVPISVVVTANQSTTIYTQDACGMYPASTGTFTIPCATNQLPDVDTCAGNNIGPFVFPIGNTWTNDNPAIGLAASGSGDIPVFTAANNATVQVGNIVVTNLCGIETFSITVYPAPTSDFLANVGCPGQPVGFTDQSVSLGGNITGWIWDFGDGSPVFNGQNPPNHIFPLGGPFNVTLTTTTANGCTHDTIIPVDPLGGLVADFITPSVCDGSPSIFTDTSTPLANLAGWAWDFDNNGTVDDVNQNSSFTFPGPGTYNVELHITGVGGCVDSITIPIVVNPIPVANFTGTNECLGTVTTFNDLSNVLTGNIIAWQWDFGDPSTIADTSILQNPTYNYTVPGTYSVMLTVTSDSGCTNVINVNVDVFSIPVANFTPSTACAGANSLFNDISVLGSSGVQFWNWDFDNNGTVDDMNQNPTYVFPGGVGNYPVSLNIIDSNGCFHDTTIVVSVSAQPTAAFTFTNECFGSATGFTDLSVPNGGTITNWDWDFQNDGTVDNTSQNATNGYPAAGNYTVELLVTTALGCVDSITMLVAVDPVPVASFTATSECVGTATTIINNSNVLTGSITAWAWDYGDMAGTSILQNPLPYTYGTSGNYTITLTVTSDSGCTNTTTVNIDVYNVPTAAFAVNDVCLNAAAWFYDLSNANGGVITNWDWDFDNNGTVDNTNQNPTNFFPGAGNYNVELIVTTAFGCADTIVQPIVIHPMPVANYSFINTCFGTSLVFNDLSNVTTGNINGWQWSFGNGNNSIVQNPAENYLSEGVYNTQLIVTTDNGCKDTLAQQVEVWPLPVVNFTPTEVCLNDTTEFNDLSTISNLYTVNSNVQWNWNFNGIGSSNLQNPNIVFGTEGVIPTTLIVTTNNGCVDSATIGVVVNPLPVIDFGPDTAACAPVCITLDNTSSISSGIIASYQWDFGDGSGAGGQNPSYCFQNVSRVATKSYDISLTATSDKGCISSDIQTNMITVNPIPLADFTIEPEITDVYDREIEFYDQSQIATIWDWDLGDGSNSIVNNPVHTYPDTDSSYIVSLYIENQYGCRDTVRREVIIKPAYAIWIPNVFTPDGDGINDFFFVQGFGLEEVQTLVFDRWGTLIFEGYQLDSKWDGTYKGKTIMVQDVFVYKVRVRDVFNEWHEFLGKVTLLK
ncbi:MAG: PKD domain-containing protein [Flavobacteriales bacterium]|nr:PKD domain-containing protein [Flavobacteriales bacterium]